MDNRIKIGQIVNTHGIKGELKAIPLTDDIERFEELEYVYIGESPVKIKLKNLRYDKGMVFFKMEGLDSINEVERYKKQYILIDENQKQQLPEDSYYLFDLMGMEVYDEKNIHIGKITNIYQTGANDVYELNDNIKLLIPAIKEVVKSVDIENHKMVIKKIEGLLDEI